MPTNANTFNSRVTSEALEKKFRDVFPAQGGAELVQDLFASGVIQPVIDFSSVAEGSVLGQNLQTAWDFSTGFVNVNNATTAFITNAGFWQIGGSWNNNVAGPQSVQVTISDGLSSKILWSLRCEGPDDTNGEISTFIVFVRSGDTVSAVSQGTGVNGSFWYRQIADSNGNLSNPLGFVFS